MQPPVHAVLRSLPGMGDTIVAVATPAGRGAIAVVRLSGNRALDIASKHVTPWPMESNKVQLSELHDSTFSLLDKALVSVFRAPNSFTGEDVVEVSSHGGLIVPQSIVAEFVSSGARQAEPGEFTRRAVANGKIDLTQAEAIADLVDARSRSMQRTALSQLDGALSRRILEMRESLLVLESFLAYDIDFPEEDDGPISRDRIFAHAEATLQSLKALISTGSVAELTREGAVVVIAGAPNAGKSSLFNALIGHSRAIVTDIPGTTRDALEAVIEAGDFPLRLVDTAGLQESSDYVEKLGIEISHKYLSAADVIIACGETTEQAEASAHAVRQISAAPLITAYTKSDLVSKSDNKPVRQAADYAISISTVTGEGIPDLLRAIERLLAENHPLETDTPLLTRTRHLSAVSAAAGELEAFITNWRADELPATVAAIHVRSAANALEELIGVVDVEHVLDKVFSSFCVGK